MSDPAYQFDSLDMRFIRAWKEVVGSSPTDWTTNMCAAGTSSFLSFSEWWTRSNPPVKIEIFRETLRILKSQYGRQPTFEDVKAVYARRAGLGSTAVRQRVAKCTRCDGTGIICFPTLTRGGVTYCVDPMRPPTLKVGERYGENTAPCICDAGKRANARWHYTDSLIQRCLRSAMTPSEMDNFRWGPVSDPCEAVVDVAPKPVDQPPEEPAVTAALQTTPRQFARMLAADDTRRSENQRRYDEKWKGIPEEDRW